MLLKVQSNVMHSVFVGCSECHFKINTQLIGRW